VRGNRHPSQTRHILDHVASLTRERIRRFGKTEGDDVAAARTDLNCINAQHAAAIRRRIGVASGVAVIGEDHEFETGARRCARDVVDCSRAVRTTGVHVNHTTDGERISSVHWKRDRR
jgi:hypothetical protein